MRLLVALATFAGISCAPATHWTDLGSIEELRDAFNRDRGNVRLVVLLSPT